MDTNEAGGLGEGGERNASSSRPMNNTKERFELRGWPLIEEWMTTLDKGMVGDFHEDINTLLTFAGLFSAVVTAFLIQLYLGLQPDSNQTTNNLLTQQTSLLSQISQQLANSSISPVDIPTPSPKFQASGSVIWISTLWFLSLILSLAAALFGMISKQWLREYLQWTTMSGPSENQVALRQARYEAFMDWKTPAIISTMPVLLEIALIVFLLGLEGLLWTLNIIVFSVCTVAVVTLIVMVIVVTVLPVFRARCPYKSPVGWAVVLVKVALSPLWNRILDLAQAIGDSLIDNSFLASSHHLPVVLEKDWRAWDFTWQTWRISGKERPEAAAASGRRQMLIRALWWIQDNSQDQWLMEAAVEGLTKQVIPSAANAFQVLVADLYFVCEHLSIDITDIVPDEDRCAVIVPGNAAVNESYRSDGSLGLTIATPDGEWRARDLRVDAPPSVFVAIAGLLTSHLLAVIANYSEGDVQSFGKRAEYFLQAAYHLSKYAARRARDKERHTSVATDLHFELADYLLRNLATNPSRFDPILQDLLDSGYRRCTPCPDTRFALYVPRGQPDSWTKADCSVFTRNSDSALWEWVEPHNHDTTIVLLPRLFDQMTACVRRCRDQGWKDCALPSDDFWWPDQLRRLFDPDHDSFSGRHLPAAVFPHELIDALRQYSDAGLITRRRDSDDITALVQRSIALKNPHMSEHAQDGANKMPYSRPTRSTAVVPPQLVAGPSTLHSLSTVTVDFAQLEEPAAAVTQGHPRQLEDATAPSQDCETTENPGASPQEATGMTNEDVALSIVSNISRSTFPIPIAAILSSSPLPVAPPLGLESSPQAQAAQPASGETTTSILDGVGETPKLPIAKDVENEIAVDGRSAAECDSPEQENGTIPIPLLVIQEISPEISSAHLEGTAVGSLHSVSTTEHLRSDLPPSLESNPSDSEHSTGIDVKRNDTHIPSTVETFRGGEDRASTTGAVVTRVPAPISHRAAASIAAEVFQDGGTTRDELEMVDVRGTCGYGADGSTSGDDRARASSSDGNLPRRGGSG